MYIASGVFITCYVWYQSVLPSNSTPGRIRSHTMYIASGTLVTCYVWYQSVLPSNSTPGRIRSHTMYIASGTLVTCYVWYQSVLPLNSTPGHISVHLKWWFVNVVYVISKRATIEQLSRRHQCVFKVVVCERGICDIKAGYHRTTLRATSVCM